MTSSTNATPALPSARGFGLPPRVGETIDFYVVDEATPERLHLRVRVVRTLFIIAVMAVVMAIAAVVYHVTPGNGETFNMDIEGGAVTVFLFGLAAEIVLVLTVGKSLTIDGVSRTVRLTRFFVFSKTYLSDGLSAVVLHVKQPVETAGGASKEPGASKAPGAPARAKSVELYLEGNDAAGKAMKVGVGSALVWTKQEWPLLGALAVRMSQMLGKPLKWDGSIDRLPEVNRGQVEEISQLAERGQGY